MLISYQFKVDFTKIYNSFKRPRNKIVRWVYSFTKTKKILSRIIPKIAINYIIKMLFTESKNQNYLQMQEIFNFTL